MAEHDPQNKETQAAHKHEESDVNISLILKISAGFVVLVILVHVIILGMYALMAENARETQPKLSPLVQKEQKKFPGDLEAIPEGIPRLQITEEQDWKKLKLEQQAKLKVYKETNKGVWQIPIDQAIRILADPKQQEARGIKGQGKK